jgi:hypothetical protein
VPLHTVGNGGDIIIDARDRIKFDDAFAASTVELTANGNALVHLPHRVQLRGY